MDLSFIYILCHNCLFVFKSAGTLLTLAVNTVTPDGILSYHWVLES